MTGDQLPMFELHGEQGPEAQPPGDVIPSRSTDPETSHVAAREIRVKAGSQRAHLLIAFNDYHWTAAGVGLTDEQAMNYAPHVSATSEYAKRCSELREGGYIEPTGETRPGSSGSARIVSQITSKGMEWIQQYADDGIGL